jgi:hypothetical protein
MGKCFAAAPTNGDLADNTVLDPSVGGAIQGELSK